MIAYNYAHARDTNMAAVRPLTSNENHLYEIVITSCNSDNNNNNMK